MWRQRRKELTREAAARGLRADFESSTENEAEIYLDEKRLCYLYYDEAEGGWLDDEYPIIYSPLGEVLDDIVARNNPKELKLQLTVEYRGKAPELSAAESIALCEKLKEAVAGILPGKPKVVWASHEGASVHKVKSASAKK